MEAFGVAMLVVAVAEIGDKTQLLSLFLAARFRRPWPIVFAIFLATLINHALAALIGQWVQSLLDANTLRWLLGLSFLAVAVWALIPDAPPQQTRTSPRFGVFVLAFVAFFVAEIGDKTQLATVMLAVRYHALGAIVAGTTLGMLVANVPVVLFGNAAAARIPYPLLRLVAAALFAVLGAMALLGIG